MRPRPRLWSGIGGGGWHKHAMKARNINFLSDALVNTSRTSFICLFLLLPRVWSFSLFWVEPSSFSTFFSLFFWKMHKSAAVDGKPERSLLLDANQQRRCIRLIWSTNCLKALQNVLKPTLMRGMFVWVFLGGGCRGGGAHALLLTYIAPCCWENIPVLAIWRFFFMHLFIVFMYCLKALLLMEHLEIGNMIDVLNRRIQSHPSLLSRMLYALLKMSF